VADTIESNGIPAWMGTWTPSGGSALAGHWTRSGEPDFYAPLSVTVDPSGHVSLYRDDPEPNKYTTTDCHYEGQLQPDGVTITGTVTCNSGVGVLGPYGWVATIQCDTTGAGGGGGGGAGGDGGHGGMGGAGPGENAGEDAGGGYLGCYADTNNPFDLDGLLYQSESLTVEECLQTCEDAGFAYAGLQYSHSCLCGDSYGRYGEADTCDMPCAGDSSDTCGGPYSNDVYEL
jgi:hypothetical protein